MALGTPTVLTENGSNTDSAFYTTASVTLVAGRLYILRLATGLTGTPVVVDSVTGNGSWTLIDTEDTGNNNASTAVLWCIGTGTTGAITVNFNNTRSNCSWAVIEITGADTTTPIRQSISASSVTTGLSATLPSAPLSTSLVLSSICYNAGSAQSLTVDSPSTALGTRFNQTSPTVAGHASYDAAPPSATVSWSSGNLSGKALVVFEVVEAPPASNGQGTGSGTFTFTGAGVGNAPTGPLFVEDFEGIADEVDITTANTAFSTITKDTTGEIKADSAYAVTGSVSARTSSTVDLDLALMEGTFTESDVVCLRVYFRPDRHLEPNVEEESNIAEFRNSPNTIRAMLEYQDPGSLGIKNGSILVNSTTTSIPVDQWTRIEWKIDTVGGTQWLRIFYGANLHGTTPDEEISGTYDNGVGIDEFWIGQVRKTFPLISWWDAVEVGEDWVGPVSNPNTSSEGSGTGAFTFTGAATGRRDPKGEGAGTFAFTGSGLGQRTPKGAASGTFTFAGAAVGSAPARGSGSGSFSFTGSGSGGAEREGTGSGVFSFTGAGVGERPAGGTGSGVFTFAGAGVGETDRMGSGAGSWGFTGTAVSAGARTGTGAGSYAFTGSGVGEREPEGTGTGSWGFTGAGVGTTERTGLGSGIFQFTGSATGGAAAEGSGSGAWSFTGSGSGGADREGTGTGAFSFTGSGTGKRPASAEGSGAWGFTGAAEGESHPQGSGSGSWGFAGVGIVGNIRYGTGEGQWIYVGEAVGTTDRSGSGSGTWTFTGSGSSVAQREGSGTGAWEFEGAGTGEAPRGGSGSGTFSFAGEGEGVRAPEGHGTGGWGFAGAAEGVTDRSGAGSGSYAFAGVALGAAPRSGTGSGTWLFVGAATGEGTIHWEIVAGPRLPFRYSGGAPRDTEAPRYGGGDPVGDRFTTGGAT